MNVTLKVWRQASRDSDGAFVSYPADGLSPKMSFLEMLDGVNERLTVEGDQPIEFESDCREGICGTCGLMINGHHMARNSVLPRANSTCAGSATVTRSPSSPGGPQRSP